MDGTVNPASIAIFVSVGTSLLAGFVSPWVATRPAKGAAVHRDPAVPVLFGSAVLLTMLNLIGAARIAIGGMAYFGLEKAALLLTASFAAAGIVLGLLRGLRSGRPIRQNG
jgi:hypothetical protein